jgi:hypothetical protein
MIVKVQISLQSSDGKTRVLAYPKDRSFQQEGVADPSILKIMGDRKKAFFFVHPKGAEGKKCKTIQEALELVIDKEAPWQEW